MLVLLLKSDQLGLFEKIVPVKGSVHSDGKFTKPHYARRKVRLPEAAPLPLFAAPVAENKPAISAKPKPEPKPKPEKAAGDLFDQKPAEVEAKEKPAEAEAPEKPKAKPRAKPKPEPKAEPSRGSRRAADGRRWPSPRLLPASTIARLIPSPCRRSACRRGPARMSGAG